MSKTILNVSTNSAKIKASHKNLEQSVREVADKLTFKIKFRSLGTRMYTVRLNFANLAKKRLQWDLLERMSEKNVYGV